LVVRLVLREYVIDRTCTKLQFIVFYTYSTSERTEMIRYDKITIIIIILTTSHRYKNKYIHITDNKTSIMRLNIDRGSEHRGRVVSLYSILMQSKRSTDLQYPFPA
jgi:hypothetical protein